MQIGRGIGEGKSMASGRHNNAANVRLRHVIDCNRFDESLCQRSRFESRIKYGEASRGREPDSSVMGAACAHLATRQNIAALQAICLCKDSWPQTALLTRKHTVKLLTIQARGRVGGCDP